MQKILGLALLLAIVFPATAQSSLQWGVELFPNLSFRRLLPRNDINRDQIDAVDDMEQGKFSYSAGLIATWRKDKLGFKTGLTFVESGYQTKRTEVDLRDEVPPGAEDERTAYQSLFVEVPAEMLFFQNFDRKNQMYFSMGLTAAFNVDNRERVTYYFGDTQDVVTELIANNPQVDFGLMLFNQNNGNDYYDENGGRVVRHLTRLEQSERDSLANLVDNLSAETWTPLCETFYEAYRYIARPDN
ncbi:MAG: outer membrane beta-barrel protein, partial [Bacteroidetes bacterium]|nr:outer membrane beta-barrel protein [Bacteroidota bacterium]